MMREELKNKLQRIVKGEHTSGEKKSIKEIRNINLDKNWERLKNSIESKHGNNLSIKPGMSMYFTLIAAAVLIIILASTVLYTFRLKSGSNIRQVSSMESNTEVILSDGTKILMNKGSLISYSEKLDRRKREVHLSGEAWFEVTKGEKSPFYVYLENSTVKVLGTSFNIREEENGKVTVSVASGKVSFYEKENKHNVVMLEAGQQGTFDAVTNEIKIGTTTSENYIFWKTGILSFKNESLDEVFYALEKYFGANIVVKNEKIMQYRLTTHCEGQALEDIMHELAVLFDLNYYSQSDTLYIE